MGFRVKFGLKTKNRHKVKWARALEILLIFYIIFTGASKTFSDLASLKYQMPYEFVERCVESQDFVNKYSKEINGSNLVWGIIEARKGLFGLDDDKYKSLYLIEAHAIQLMSYDEFSQLQVAPKNMLLMIKKYVPDSYTNYVEILSEAAILGVQYGEELDELIKQYKTNMDSLPQWVFDFANSEDLPNDEYEFMTLYNEIMIEHIDDEDIVDILKTLSSQAIEN